jgi:hypothetical protein
VVSREIFERERGIGIEINYGIESDKRSIEK